MTELLDIAALASLGPPPSPTPPLPYSLSRFSSLSQVSQVSIKEIPHLCLIKLHISKIWVLRKQILTQIPKKEATFFQIVPVKSPILALFSVLTGASFSSKGEGQLGEGYSGSPHATGSDIHGSWGT